MNKKTQNANEAFSQYTGTGHYYRFSHFTRLVITDGIQALSEACGSFWFLDVIASYQPQLAKEEFQLWELTLDNRNGCTITCGDGNGNTLVTQAVPFTDFPYGTLQVFVENEVIYLPSER